MFSFKIVILATLLILPLNLAAIVKFFHMKVLRVQGTVLLLAGEHTTNETVEITRSLTLTAEPGAVWTSTADPAIAVHANDVTIQI